MLKARFAKGLQTNIYFVNVKVDGKYDCREKVSNIYEVNVKGGGKNDKYALRGNHTGKNVNNVKNVPTCKFY